MRFRASRMLATGTASVAIVILQLLSQPVTGADEWNGKTLEQAYQHDISLLAQRYCHKCHSPKRTEADIDLAAFASWVDVRKHLRTWQKVSQMLDSGQMPPKGARQPSSEERARLQQWVQGFLTVEAKARSGDPGRVVLRRLSNVEYTYTLHDLTGIDSLDPAREFPVDGAAGEGFTNTGNALVMSPTLLTKYLAAAKEAAGHAVLLPDGFRFSPHATRRDWTNEILARIREIYRESIDPGSDQQVNLQGIMFETNGAGRLPLEKYLAATLTERAALRNGRKTIETVARERGLNAKYLGTLWESLNASEPSLLLDGVRVRWRSAKPDAAAALANVIGAWQKDLWTFAPVGHIGKVGGPKAWQQPVNPLVAKQDVRFKIPASPDGKEVVISLVASDAGDGSLHDIVVWQQPRLVAPGRPDLLLRDVRQVRRDLTAQRDRLFARTAEYLSAAAEAGTAQGTADHAQLARKHGVEADVLLAWLDYLGISHEGAVALRGHLTNKIVNTGGYDFINGWGNPETPFLLANSSGQHVRVPGNMKPHSVAVHPAATQRVGAGWRSPVTSSLLVEGEVTHAHPECGNGVTWALELRRGTTRRRLAAGTAQGDRKGNIGLVESLAVQPGDVVTLLVGPRDGSHGCDLTEIALKLSGGGRTWDLAGDVTTDVLAGNPHADRFGNDHVWHFYAEPDKDDVATDSVVPAGSLLARWQATKSADEKRKLAGDVQGLLTSGPPAAAANPDAKLYRQLASSDGPLLGVLSHVQAGVTMGKAAGETSVTTFPAPGHAEWGLDPATFGKLPDGTAIDAASLGIRAPSMITVRLPADLVSGRELVATGVLDKDAGAEGSVQLEVVAGKPAREPGPLPSDVTVTAAGATWTTTTRQSSFARPIIVNERSATRQRIESAFDDFRRIFPAALCYTRIVPVDEVVTLTLFYREDDQLVRLMLDEAQHAKLDRLWDELHYISQDALTLVDVLPQLIEYATQDADPKVFEPLRKPFADRAGAFRQRLIETQAKHLDALLDFAARAFRSPLTDDEVRALRMFYSGLREQEVPHEEAFRLTLARVLIAPSFLYRIEKPGPGAGQGPISDFELASRLSYFLWSSQPDDELRQVAAAGRLRDPNTLAAQMRRMLRDARTRRLATEFACQWLHIHDFDRFDEKSERHFPTFAGIRGAMYEESIQFFTDFFQNNGSVIDILDADHTFLNDALAKHYGIPGVLGAQWRRVDGVKKYFRGGILGQATTLSAQSGASRTSPILRGNWISEVLLGERLPRPPKGVPLLPDDESATKGLTFRQLVEQHSRDAKCMICHRRIDPFGFSLEAFDAIGRHREKDSAGLPIDSQAHSMDGAQFEGLDGLRHYLLTARREAFLRQFHRKLLGYALGRAVQLSDEPLLAELRTKSNSGDGRILPIVEAIIRSRQFREIRGRETAYDDE
jgi:Protein of unknown function (DUF1592)/Protein of unknown function (DUF1588)/Protein of unknown function (DUF1587)/Protein of unknown function (DUF1585)/Protein of unknown function (DUF1595)/Planctomycete cytochrome C